MSDFTNIRALTFDVFGTVVDWRSGIAREAEAMLAPKGHAFDWGAFANAWRKQILHSPVQHNRALHLQVHSLQVVHYKQHRVHHNSNNNRDRQRDLASWQ